MIHCVEIHRDTLPYLQNDPYKDQLSIIEIIDTGEDIILLKITSPGITTSNIQQELYFEGSNLKFKPWTDT